MHLMCESVAIRYGVTKVPEWHLSCSPVQAMDSSGSQTLILSPFSPSLEVGQDKIIYCQDVSQLGQFLNSNVDVLVLDESLFDPKSQELLKNFLGRQASRSQIPIFILCESLHSQPNNSFHQFPYPLKFIEKSISKKSLRLILDLALQTRALQKENRELAHAASLSRLEATNAQRVKNDFLTNISHEIRTPLGAVMGFSELLMEPDLTDSDRQAYVKTIKRNGQVLAALIDDVLDLARVEVGKIEIEIHDVVLPNLISEVFSSLESRAIQKNVQLELKMDPKMPPSIQTDPFRLKQILSNIIGNAIKFTNQGKVSVKVLMKSSDQLKEKLQIEVSDSGIGIAKQMQKNLFQPFSQADSSATRIFGGTGLGLMLSRELARALGGDLKITHSAPGEGSTFCIEVDTGLPAFPKIRGIHDIAGMKILLVEDSVDNQVLISRMLKLGGATVSVASDGIEGIRKALNSDINAILMDVQMPRLGGHEATRELRRRGFEKPIIAITAHAMEEDRNRCVEAGFDEYLTKPVDRQVLFEALAFAAGKTHSDIVASQFH